MCLSTEILIIFSLIFQLDPRVASVLFPAREPNPNDIRACSVFLFPHIDVYTCIENIGEDGACLRDDNDDEPTGLLDFEREREEGEDEEEDMHLARVCDVIEQN